MKILINLSVIRSGGGLQVGHSFIHELKNFGSHEYYIVISPAINAIIEPTRFPDNFTFTALTSFPATFPKGLKAIRRIKKVEKRTDPDVVFTLFGPSYWKPQTPHLCGFALGHFIYEDSDFYQIISSKERLRWKILGCIKLWLLKRQAGYFITETQDAADRLAHKLNIPSQNTFVVNNIYNGTFDKKETWKAIPKKATKAKGFKLLTITRYHKHKNLESIPSVIDYICDFCPNLDFTFILTVNKNKLSNLTERQQQHILFLGPVDIETCPTLYEQSDALYMPTLLECFTVSYLEAMKMDTPILTSDLSFAHDICGEAAHYFDPMDPKDIGEKIVELAQNDSLQQKLIQRGCEQLKKFGTGKDRAAAYLNILKEIAKENKG